MPLFGSSSASKPFTVDFPSQYLVHGPGSVVAGSVSIDPVACNQDGVDSIEVSVICKQTSVYYRYYEGNSHDYRKQVCTLYSEVVKLWTCSESGPVDGRALVTPITSPSASSTIVNYGNTPAFSSAETSHVDEDILSRIRGRLSTKGKAKELFQPTAGCFSLPFAMPLPSGSTNLPPSFEAGTLQGKPVGQEMGFTRWAVRVVGRRKGLLRSDRKALLVFVYLPSYVTPPNAVPPPLLPREDGSPAPRPGQNDGWQTIGVMRTRREGVFKKKGLLVAQLALPDLPSYPSPLDIPFHLTVLHLSPPLDGPTTSNGSKSSIRPTDIKTRLVRCVWTEAHGGEQSAQQSIVDDAIVASTRQVWVGEQRVFDESAWSDLKSASKPQSPQQHDHEQTKGGDESDDDVDEADVTANGVCRAGYELVVTGCLRFNVGPSFQAGISPKGHLACSYILQLILPLSRAFSSSTSITLVDFDPGLPLSTILPDSQGVPPIEALELDPELAAQANGGRAGVDELIGLPGYFEVVGKLGEDWGNDEKK